MNQEITKQIKIPDRNFLKMQKEIKDLSTFKKKLEENLKAKVTEIIELIIGGAIILNVSDLHIETQKEDAKLRIRIDGILHEVSSFPLDVYQKLASRIKLLSEVKLNVTDRPQDGRFSVLAQDNPIEIRSSTLPSEYGESFVLRVLNPKTLISLEDLGIRKDLLEIMRDEIKKPHGMIIVTGPTGSGKTTSLYSFLKKIRSPEAKIITIEDPIEYHLSGISQTQTSPEKGYDFASGLKSIMRQDPNVILVGEIRGLETAQIAIQAALTGHLVLTTLHTNNAAGTVPRLVSLGAKPVNIAPALNVSIAQRLIRKVCEKCKKMKTVTSEELKKLRNELKDISILKDYPKLKENLKIPKIKGCKSCNFTGYKGRIAVFEVLKIDQEMESFILTSPSISALRKKATERGMITLHQDGLLKVLEGLSTIEEIDRVAPV